MKPAFYEQEHDNLMGIETFATVEDCHPHFHTSFEFYYVIEGKVTAVINDRISTLDSGEMALSLNCDIHSYHFEEPGRAAVLIIPPMFTGEFTKSIGEKSLRSPFVLDKALTGRLYWYMQKIGENLYNPFMVRGYIYVLFGLMLENLVFEAQGRSKERKELPQKILSYMNENFTEQLTLKKIAADLGYNSFYISKFFNANFNCSFTDYLNMLRLRRFIAQVSENDETITSNALACGFNCIRTFNRAFKKEFKLSPKEYLKQHNL